MLIEIGIFILFFLFKKDAFETLLADMAAYYEHSGTPVDKSMLIKNAW